MEMENSEGELFVIRRAHEGFEKTIGLAAKSSVVDGVNDGKAAEQRDGVTLALSDDQVHAETLTDAIEDVGVVGFNQCHQVGALGFDDFGQRISAAFAAVEDVVGEEPQSTHVSSAPQFRFIIGQR